VSSIPSFGDPRPVADFLWRSLERLWQRSRR
jgi:hypothetical protein